MITCGQIIAVIIFSITAFMWYGWLWLLEKHDNNWIIWSDLDLSTFYYMELFDNSVCVCVCVYVVYKWVLVSQQTGCPIWLNMHIMHAWFHRFVPNLLLSQEQLPLDLSKKHEVFVWHFN